MKGPFGDLGYFDKILFVALSFMGVMGCGLGVWIGWSVHRDSCDEQTAETCTVMCEDLGHDPWADCSRECMEIVGPLSDRNEELWNMWLACTEEYERKGNDD